MTDVKKLRELAEKATPGPKHFAVEDTFPTMWLVDENGERHEIMNDDLIFWAAANPQAIIELLDRLERYERALEKIPLTQFWAEAAVVAREALEGGKP
jgi:hypothetical protein